MWPRGGRAAAAWAVFALLTLVAQPRAENQADGPETRAPASVVSSSSDGVVFRVDLEPWTVSPSPALDGADRLAVPRFVDRGNPGEPSRPARKFLVGVRPEGTWTLSFRVLESVSLGQLRVEPVPYPEVHRDDDLGAITSQRFEIDPAVYEAFESPPVVSGAEVKAGGVLLMVEALMIVLSGSLARSPSETMSWTM